MLRPQSGVILPAMGVARAAAPSYVSAGGAPLLRRYVLFTTSGAVQTVVVPAGATRAVAAAIGGGANGYFGSGGVGSYGGGGGAFARAAFDVAPDAVVEVTIAPPSTVGGNTTISYGGTVRVLAAGGFGSSGGFAASCVGDIVRAGASGVGFAGGAPANDLADTLSFGLFGVAGATPFNGAGGNASGTTAGAPGIACVEFWG